MQYLALRRTASFLFSTIDGTISAWDPSVGVAPGSASPSTNAVVVVKNH
jgi:hypothetical protein